MGHQSPEVTNYTFGIYSPVGAVSINNSGLGSIQGKTMLAQNFQSSK